MTAASGGPDHRRLGLRGRRRHRDGPEGVRGAGGVRRVRRHRPHRTEHGRSARRLGGAERLCGGPACGGARRPAGGRGEDRDALLRGGGAGGGGGAARRARFPDLVVDPVVVAKDGIAPALRRWAWPRCGRSCSRWPRWSRRTCRRRRRSPELRMASEQERASRGGEAAGSGVRLGAHQGRARARRDGHRSAPRPGRGADASPHPASPAAPTTAPAAPSPPPSPPSSRTGPAVPEAVRAGPRVPAAADPRIRLSLGQGARVLHPGPLR